MPDMTELESLLRHGTDYPPEFVTQIVEKAAGLTHVGGGATWIRKISNCVRSGGQTLHRDLKALIFELKVIDYLTTRLGCRSLRYEPAGINQAGPTVDLEIEGHSRLVEMKTLQPQDRQRDAAGVMSRS